MTAIFFAYSHEDETMRNELEKHLSTLKRQNLIKSWHDRRIRPGDDWSKTIDQNLNTADVILLLISHNFLASDYCYDVEMQRAMERHRQGEARVIPVILQPCDWEEAPFGTLQATPTDGKPIAKFANPNDGFLDVVRAVKQAIASEDQSNRVQSGKAIQQLTTGNVRVVSPVRSSNLSIKKEFTEQDRDRFLEEAFSYIAKYFENSLSELESRNQEISTNFRRTDANNFTAKIYKNGSLASQCHIWFGSMMGGRYSNIFYSNNADGGSSGYNESLSVFDNGNMLMLKADMRRVTGSRDNIPGLSDEGAAEYYWSKLIEWLQR